MNQKALLKLIKPFVPDLQNQAIEALEQLLKALIDGSQSQMNADEQYVAVLIVRYNGLNYILLATFDRDDRLKRVLQKQTIQEFMQQLLTNTTCSSNN